MLKKASLLLLIILYISGGINHFVHPEAYLPIIPYYLPFPVVINIASGVLEIILGAMLVFSKTRALAASTSRSSASSTAVSKRSEFRLDPHACGRSEQRGARAPFFVPWSRRPWRPAVRAPDQGHCGWSGRIPAPPFAVLRVCRSPNPP